MYKITKKIGLLLFLTAGFAANTSAQSAIEALKLTDTDLLGTARFVSMGGAFTALGGDISTLSQNPAGIGVYRTNEVVTTLTIAPQSTQVTNLAGNSRNSKTRVNFDNLGFVGTFNFRGSMLRNINFGVAYNSRKNYARNYRVNYNSLNGSLTNAIAGLCSENPNNLLTSNGAYENGAAWLDVLAYDNFLIAYSPTATAANNSYYGLFADGSTSGNGYLDVRESGYNNEYTFNFGGNIADRVFFGIGVGVTDLKYELISDYGENLYGTNGETEIDATLYPMTTSEYSLYNELVLNGTGVNFKAGLIAYVTNSWRIGAAIQTPTGTTISERWFEDLDVVSNGGSSSDGTPEGNFNYRLTSPFRYNLGLAYTFGNFGLISFDYESVNYGSMRFKNTDRSTDGFDAINDDIYKLYGASHSFRAGLEININPYVAVRGGFNMITPGELSLQGDSGNNTYIYSGGLGFKTNGSFYADLAFRYNDNPDIYYKPYADYIDDMPSPQLRVKNKLMSFVATIGFRF